MDKHTLMSYRDKQAAINNLKDRIDEITAILERVTPVPLDTAIISHGKSGDKMAGLIAELVDTKEKLCKQAKAAEEQAAQIEGFIESIENPNHRKAIRLYFIGCLTMDEVARKCNYSDRKVIDKIIRAEIKIDRQITTNNVI